MKSNLHWIALVAALCGLAASSWGYSVITANGNAVTWDSGTITMSLKLGNTAALQDGSTYNSSVSAAIAAWNAVLGQVQISGSDAGNGSAADANGINEIAFANSVYGDAFGSNVLAVTLSYRSSAARSDGTYRRTQSDILFNTAYTWDSYSSSWQSSAKDIRRVALHELGHVLGLTHPDEAGQSVTAIMNSTVSSVTTLQTDDISGAQSLYGGPGSATAPTVTTHPANVTVRSGSYASFSVAANGSATLSYRWQVLVPGGSWTNITGSPYSGATSSAMGWYPDLSYTGNKYRCVVTNSAGSATSDEATLTVTGTAPSVYYHPANQTIIFGNDASLSASFSGTTPISYRWQVMVFGGTTWSDLADGTYYTGTGSNYLNVKRPPTSFSGNAYRCVASNALGSVVSNAAFLTVNPAVAPSIGTLSSTTLDYGGYLGFSPSINGSSPMTYQWYRNGVAIANATSSYYSKSPVTTADSGSYSLSVTNAAGTVSSNSATVVVNAAVAPTITQQPVSVSVAKGNYFSLGASVSGSPTLRYQWYRDGIALSGATSSYYSVGSAAAIDTASYYLKVTNDAGTATSSTVSVSVIGAARPTIIGLGGQITINDSSNYISIYPSVSGSPPIAYQWFKDGVPIPGATSNSYSKYNVTAADAGVYTLRATNEGGLAVSAEYTVVWSINSTPWVDAVQLGDVVYFLFSAPARILRYDLAKDGWLPIVYLGETRAPTAFLPTSEGVFIAFDKELVRRSTDLASETAVLTSTQTIKSMWNIESSLYFADGSSLKRVNRSTLAVVSMSPAASYGLSYGGFTRTARPVYAASNRTLYSTRPGVSPNDIMFYPVATDGSLTAEKDSPYHGDFSVGTRQYLNPDESLLIDNSGVVYNSGPLTFAKSVGSAFDDLGFLASGAAIVLRRNKLTLHAAGNLLEQGTYTLGDPASGVFCRGSNAYAFGGLIPGSGNPTVTKVPVDAFSSVPPAGLSPIGQLCSVDYVFGDDAGMVYVLSRSARTLMCWNAATRKFTSIIALRGSPTRWNYSRSSNRLFLSYADGLLTRFDLRTSMAEQLVVNVGFSNSGYLTLMGMDDTVLVQPSNYIGMVFSLDGVLNSLRTNSYYGSAVGWTRSSRRLYYNDSGTTYYFTVSNSGTVPSQPEASVSSVSSPLRFNADGSLILAGGAKVVNAGLQTVATLPNTVVDGVWLGDFFYGIREKPTGTEVQKIARITYTQDDSAVVPGTPLAIFAAAADQVAVVTLVKGYLAIHLLDQNLGVLHSAVNDSNYAQLPTVVTQPTSVSAVAGDQVQFSVGSIGSPTLRYYWQVSAAGSTTWTDLANGGVYSGVNTATLTVANVTTGFNGNAYRCAIFNGSGVAISDWAGLSVSATGASPSVSTQPVGAAVTTGANAAFTVAASGSPTLRYFWQVAAPGSASWTDLADNATYLGTNTATLTVKAATLGLSGYAYRCAIFNGYGYAISDWASLTVSTPAVAPSVSTHPTNSTINSGGTATFTVSGAGTATLRYYWQVSTPGSTSWTDLTNGGIYSGVNTATLTVTGATSGQSGNAYRCAIFNAAGYAISDWASLTVSTPAVAPSVSTHPTNSTINSGGTATFTVSGAGTATLRYYWQVSTPGSTSWTDLTNGGIYSGVNTATLTVTGATSGQSGNAYRCAIFNAAGYAISDWASLTVSTPAVAPSVTDQPADTTVAQGADATFTVGISGTAPLLHYWQLCAPGTTSWVDINGGVYSGFQTATLTIRGAPYGLNGYAYRCVVYNEAGFVISNWATLTVTGGGAAPAVTAHPSNTAQVVASMARFDVSASGALPLRYYWQVSLPGTTTWTDLANDATYSGVNTATLWVNTSVSPSVVSGAAYRCAIFNNFGYAISNWATLTIISAMHETALDSVSSYDTWARMYFTAPELADPAISGLEAINGHDGLTNLLKYALGLEPKQDGTAAIPQTTRLDDHWFYTYRRPATVSDVNYRVEVSIDLINWTDVGVTQEITADDGAWQTWQAQYHSVAGQTVIFRLVPILK